MLAVAAWYLTLSACGSTDREDRSAGGEQALRLLATAEKVQSLSLDGGDMLLGYSAPRTWEWREEPYRPKDAFELVLALIRDDGSVAWRHVIPQVEGRSAHGERPPHHPVLWAWVWQPFAKLAVASTHVRGGGEHWYLIDVERGELADEVDPRGDDGRASLTAVEYAAFGNAPLIAVRWSGVLQGPHRDPQAPGGFVTSCDVVTLDGRVVHSISESEFGWNFERPPHLGRSDPLFGPQYSRLGAELLRTHQSGEVRVRVSQTRWVGLAAALDADGETWRVTRVE